MTAITEALNLLRADWRSDADPTRRQLGDVTTAKCAANDALAALRRAGGV